MGGSTNGDAFIGTGTVMSNGTTVANAQIFLDGQFIASSIVVPAEQSFVDLTTPFTFAGTLRAMNGSDEIFDRPWSVPAPRSPGSSWINPVRDSAMRATRSRTSSNLVRRLHRSPHRSSSLGREWRD